MQGYGAICPGSERALLGAAGDQIPAHAEGGSHTEGAAADATITAANSPSTSSRIHIRLVFIVLLLVLNKFQ